MIDKFLCYDFFEEFGDGTEEGNGSVIITFRFATRFKDRDYAAHLEFFWKNTTPET